MSATLSKLSVFVWKKHTDFITCRLSGCALLSCKHLFFFTLPGWQRRGLNGFTYYHIPSSFSLVMFTVFFFFKETFVHNLLKQNIFFLKQNGSRELHYNESLYFNCKQTSGRRRCSSVGFQEARVVQLVSFYQRGCCNGHFGNSCNIDSRWYTLFLVVATLRLIRLNGGPQTKKSISLMS